MWEKIGSCKLCLYDARDHILQANSLSLSHKFQINLFGGYINNNILIIDIRHLLLSKITRGLNIISIAYF